MGFIDQTPIPKVSIVHLAADITTTSTSLTDATGMVVPVLANSSYLIEFFLMWRSSATTVGIGFSATGPTSPTDMNIWKELVSTTDTSQIVESGNGDNDTPGVTTAVAASGTTYRAKVEVQTKTGANAGNVQLRWRAEQAGTVTLRAGSHARAWKLA